MSNNQSFQEKLKTFYVYLSRFQKYIGNCDILDMSGFAYTHNVIDMIVRTNLPVQSFIQFSDNEIPIAFILHKFLQSIEFEPTNSFASHDLSHDLHVKMETHLKLVLINHCKNSRRSETLDCRCSCWIVRRFAFFEVLPD